MIGDFDDEFGEEYVPRTRAHGEAPAQLEPGHPWVYAHPRNRWTIDPKYGRILPELVQIESAPGVNHTGKGGDASLLKQRFENEGCKLLPHNIIAQMPGVKAQSYVRKVPVAVGGRRGYAYLTWCTRAFPGSATLVPDTEAFNDFRAWLVEAGHIAPPDIHTLKAHRAEAQRRFDAYRRAAKDNPASERPRDQWALTLQAYDAHIAAIEAGAEPDLSMYEANAKPKPARKPRSKPTPSDEATDQ